VDPAYRSQDLKMRWKYWFESRR